MSAVGIGALRRRVELLNVAATETAAGGWTRNDAVAATVFAAVAPATWRQQEAHGGRLERRVSHVVTVRWRRDLAQGFGPEARVRFTDAAGRVRELSVKTVVDPDERGRWLELGCVEGGPL